ncbi:MAG: radical SAM protein [Candidatus Jordarchaeaceae archaeon]
MKVLLINIPYPFNEGPTPPLGLCYLAAVLEREGFEVQILDLLVSRFSLKKIADKMREYKPEIVGAGPITISYPNALRALEVCKKFGATTVMGGCHVTFYDREALREAPYLDIVVRGEGEYTLLDIVRGRDLKDIDGITYREDGEIIQNPPRKFIENLDELPFPAKHLLPLSKYRAYKTGCAMMTGRGCPYSCTFCVGGKMVGKKPRFRDIKLCIDELEEIVFDYGFDLVNVVDDLLTINHKRVFAFCDEIISRGIKVKWTAFSRVDTVTKELLSKMKEAGCIFILYGVESGNQKILDLAKKRTTLEKIRRGVAISNEVGMCTLSSFILGLPGETKETIRESLEFGKSLGNWYGFHILTPYPGTEIRERANELGLKILHNDWSRYDANQAITETEEVSAEYINKVAKEFYDSLQAAITQREEEHKRLGTLTPEEKEFIELRERRIFTWHILKRDYIERHGNFTVEGDPIDLLAAEIQKIPSISSFMTRERIAQEIRSMVDEGILSYKRSDNSVTWQWTDLSGRRRHREVTLHTTH